MVKTYNVYLNFSGCIALQVEADSEDDAIETAYDLIDNFDMNKANMNWSEDVMEAKTI